MFLFDPNRFASFAERDLTALEAEDPLWMVNASRREAALMGEEDRTSADWQLRYARFLLDTAAYERSLQVSENVLASSQDPTVRFCALALRCRTEFRMGMAQAARPHLDEFLAESDGVKDPHMLAVRALIQGAYLAAGATGVPDAPVRASEYFLQAAVAFESLNDVNLAILSRIELSAMLASSGLYIRAINQIELASRLAEANGAYHYAGRMLAIGASAAIDQGYRRGLEGILSRSVAWSDFVGDRWARHQAHYALGRMWSYQMPSNDPVAAERPEKLLLQTIQEAEADGAKGLAAHVAAALAWLYTKSGEAERRQRVVEHESERVGGGKGHFENMATNAADVVKTVNLRIASRLHDGIENHPDAFMIFDIRTDGEHGSFDFINEYRNEVAATMLNLAPSEMLLYSEMQNHPHLKDLSEPLLDAVLHRRSFEDYHEFQEGEDSCWYARKVVPSGDGAILIVRDVTAERRIELALLNAAASAERSDRSKSEFLANMSHEIRTPINGVLGLARLLADTPLDPIQRAYVEDIIGSGDILISVIGNVLDLSKMESHSMTIDIRPSIVEDIVAGTVRLYHGQAREKGIHLTTHIDPSTPQVILADGTRIRQVVANLVGNAVKFTNEGSVSVNVRREGEMLSIEVKDTGMGIPYDRLEAVFDRFQQASPASRAFGGTGLGLTISRGIVGLMGGSIEVQSEVGKGSCFTVWLPITETAETQQRKQGPMPPPSTGARVLLVDDNRINKMVSEYALQRLGCEVTLASNGAEALEIWETEGLDLVLMDIRMPVLDGLEATRELRRREKGRGTRTPIVALTAGALLEERNECFEAGMDDYISKPFTNDLLQEVLLRWLPENYRLATHPEAALAPTRDQ